MATNLQFKCDGCGSEKCVPVGKIPEGWGRVSIKVTGLSRPYAVSMMDDDRIFDLCGVCQSHLADSAFPPGWPLGLPETAAPSPEPASC